MVKHCLNELLAITSEPLYSLQLDLEDQGTVDVIRYELIQWLVLRNFSMSDLESRVIVWGKVERPDIRPILDSIATFDGTQWRLKPECYSEFNPHFRKYEKFHDSVCTIYFSSLIRNVHPHAIYSILTAFPT